MFPETEDVALIHQAQADLAPDGLLIIIGPTASGKTRLATALAKRINGEIISADSRQVYRRLDIGTGKDLHAYGQIPYHLIDIAEPEERYDVERFKVDFFAAKDAIVSRKNIPILCGGTASYVQSILQDSPYAQIPRNSIVQAEIAQLSKEDIRREINSIGQPANFRIDINSHKRLVRALEILRYIQQHAPELYPQRTEKKYRIFAINPARDIRRQRIEQRLLARFEEGLVDEVRMLHREGISFDRLDDFGLEYRYIAQHLQGILSYEQLVQKLTTEINRFAKRQMTYFRKMERDGLPIHWLPSR